MNPLSFSAFETGDRFALERDAPHAERYGAQGAAYRVARCNRCIDAIE